MFSIYTLEESEQWNEIVKSFKNHDIYYLSEYVKGFQIHGDGEPLLFHYDNGIMRAINVVMKRDIAESDFFKDRLALESYYDVSTPYGYGGFILEGDIQEKNLAILEEAYIKICRKENIISEFVRFHPVINNVEDVLSIYGTNKLGRTITMALDSPKQIWDDLTGKNRNVTRKALKSEVEIYWGRDSKLFNDFITMYNETMDKDDAESYYYFNEEFYKSILTDLKYKSFIFYAKYEGEIIAMSIILFSNDQLHYHLSASKKEFMKLSPNNLMLYEAASWGAENGYKSFHLGGGLGGQKDGLFNFKKSFNKESKTTFSIGKKIFDQEKYDELINIRKNSDKFDETSTFFPIYRG